MEVLGHARDTDSDGATILSVGDTPDLASEIEAPSKRTDGIDAASVATATEALGAIEREAVSCVVTAAS